MPPTTPSQIEIVVEVQEVSPPHQAKQASLFMPKKGKKIKSPIKKRQRVIKKVVPIPSIPKPILEEDEEEYDEDNILLNRRT